MDPRLTVTSMLSGGTLRQLAGADLAGYGVRSGIAVGGADIVLNNAAGFFTVCQARLFMSINTPTSNRRGPGYVLELVPEG